MIEPGSDLMRSRESVLSQVKLSGSGFRRKWLESGLTVWMTVTVSESGVSTVAIIVDKTGVAAASECDD
jgi:hypothetical protein